jgi:hypothetical protein
MGKIHFTPPKLDRFFDFASNVPPPQSF